MGGFREEVQPDGRVARTGPEILPASDNGGVPRYMYLDPFDARHVLPLHDLAVTEDGTLARAFAATPERPTENRKARPSGADDRKRFSARRRVSRHHP
jgi:hypothetical protein